MTRFLMTRTPAGRRGAARATTLALALVTTVAAGCGSLLDVENPNNVNAESLDNPASAAAQVNGIVGALTRGAIQLLGHASTASDELTWVGSLDGMNLLNRGMVRDPFNEFLEDAAIGLTPARYMAARTVPQLEKFRAEGNLTDPTQLALANLYAAVTYNLIANHYDDFVIASDMRVSGAPVGAERMVTLFDSAETAATRGLTAAPAGNATLRGQLLAVRARARFDRAVWRKLNPSGRAPAQPLVDDAGAAEDARAALPLLGSDGRLQLVPQAGMGYGNCFLPACVNNRQEVRFNRAHATYNYTTRALTVALRDPISGQPDPALAFFVNEFVTANLLSPATVTGSRDMLLILAEGALARGNTTEFAEHINRLRALHQLPAWTGAAGQPSARDLLIHSRLVNLYLQGRRLNDMYRFGIVDPEWPANSDAAQCPGSLFPINNSERLANPAADASPPTCGR